MKKLLLAALLMVFSAAFAQQTPQLVQSCVQSSGNPYFAPTYSGADAMSLNNSTLTNGTVSNGLFSSGTVTNPTAGQVIIGPIDTTGAASWNFYLAVTSGSGSTVMVQESQTGAANTWSTVPGLGNGSQSLMTLGGMTSNTNSQTGAVRQRYLQVVASAATEVLQVSGYLRSAPFVATYSGPTQIAYGATALQSIAANGGTYSLYESSSRYLPVVPYSIPEATWQWSTNGTAITTNTTTTLQAAQAATVRNYLAALTCDNSGTGAATELQILDGSTVIYDGFIGAASATLNAPHFTVTFPVPLRGTAATAMSLKTLTTGAALYCSAQGYAAY